MKKLRESVSTSGSTASNCLNEWIVPEKAGNANFWQFAFPAFFYAVFVDLEDNSKSETHIIDRSAI